MSIYPNFPMVCLTTKAILKWKWWAFIFLRKFIFFGNWQIGWKYYLLFEILWAAHLIGSKRINRKTHVVMRILKEPIRSIQNDKNKGIWLCNNVVSSLRDKKSGIRCMNRLQNLQNCHSSPFFQEIDHDRLKPSSFSILNFGFHNFRK